MNSGENNQKEGTKQASNNKESQKTQNPDTKEQRLAKALKQNLRRRKLPRANDIQSIKQPEENT